jgi:hypothetical protein
MVRYWNPSRELRNNVIEIDTWQKDTEAGKAIGFALEYTASRCCATVFSFTNFKTALAENIKNNSTAELNLPENSPPDKLTSPNKTTNETIINAENNNKTSLISNIFNLTSEWFGQKTRHSWDNPVIWREIMTSAYGRRIWVVHFGFIAFFVICLQTLHTTLITNIAPTTAELSLTVVPLFLLSLVLVNTQAITSQTSEKDAGTFELLLVSDITPKEYVFGKLGGVMFNMKWVILLPILICGYLYFHRAIDGQLLFFLVVGLIVLYAFTAMVGVYIGMQYDNTKAAMATSLGIVFFLFVGVAACIWIMVAFSGSFETQLIPFSSFMIGGGIGLYTTLGARNPSTAIATASFILPISVFYVITTMLLGAYHLVFVVLVVAFGFTTIAMLIPSIAEFDVATGRTTDG